MPNCDGNAAMNDRAQELSPVFGWLKRPTMIDYPGRLAATFFFSGCNFRCGFCHNAGLLGAMKPGVSWSDLETACRKFRADWVEGAVLSGGEPTLAPGLPEVMRRFRGLGFRLKLDTNGSRPEVLAALLPEFDYVAMDVKTELSGYPDLTGFARPDAIAQSVRLIRDKARDYEFRTTVIEGVHTDEVMRGIGELIRGARRYIIQPFVPKEDLLEERWRKLPRTAPDRLAALADLMKPFAETVAVRGQ